MSEKRQEEEFGRSTTAEDVTIPDPPRLPSGDYSYTVELVGSIQHQLGRLTQAVESLTSKSGENEKELKKLSQDVHTAKTLVKVLGGLILLVCGFIAWTADTYLSMRPNP